MLINIMTNNSAMTAIILLAYPSMHPLIGNPKGFNLSYESTCQIKFGPCKMTTVNHIVVATLQAVMVHVEKGPQYSAYTVYSDIGTDGV